MDQLHRNRLLTLEMGLMGVGNPQDPHPWLHSEFREIYKWPNEEKHCSSQWPLEYTGLGSSNLTWNAKNNKHLDRCLLEWPQEPLEVGRAKIFQWPLSGYAWLEVIQANSFSRAKGAILSPVSQPSYSHLQSQRQSRSLRFLHQGWNLKSLWP